MSKQTNKVDWAIWGSFLVVVGATAGAIGAYYNHFGRNLGNGFSEKVEVWAQFGDYFGGLLNPVIAFVAFLWLVRSVKLQQEELRKMNTEIEATRRLQEKQDARAEEAAMIAGFSNIIEMTKANMESCRNKIKTLESTFIDSDDPDDDAQRSYVSRLKEQLLADEVILVKALNKQRKLVFKHID